MSTGGPRLKRYTLVLPEELFVVVQQRADQRGTTVVDLLRRFIRLGLLVLQLEDTPDATLIIREGGTDRLVPIIG